MKLYLLLPLATLTIGLAVPALAQQEKTTVDAQTVQQLHAIGSKSDEAFKKGDAGARAALFTEDAILLGPNGPIKGGLKILYGSVQKVHFIENNKIDDSPHVIGTSGNDVWESGEWSCSIEDQNGVPKQLKGYWCSVKVREGDTWKIRLSTNIPAAVAAGTPSTTTK